MEKTRKITMMGFLLAIIMVLSLWEQNLPPLLLLPPQVKLGLGNVVIMYAVYFMSPSDGIVLTISKSILIFITRSPVAGLMSFAGGILSILVIILVYKRDVSLVFVSVCSAVAHNLGQLCMSYLLLGNVMVLYQGPLLLLAGILLGIVTGMMLQAILPVIKQIIPSGVQTVKKERKTDEDM